MGFFTNTEINNKFNIENMPNPLPSCAKCKMYIGCRHPKTSWTGKGRLKTLIVAEAMGKDEDLIGTQLIGQVGQFFRGKLKDNRLDLDNDFWKMNAVACFPRNSDGNTRPPTKDEIQCCRPMVEEAIEELNPDFIWVLGGSAIKSFYTGVFSEQAISRWRKLCIPDRKYDAYIIPQFHPSFAFRDENNKTLQSIYDSDLKFAISCLKNKPLEKRDNPEPYILYNIDNILYSIDNINHKEPEYLSFDYETNCLKPQRPGAKIASISFRYDDTTCSFPYQYQNHFNKSEQIEIKRRWRKVLTNPKIGKVAHGMKFEDNWSRCIMGVTPTNWKQCTMVSSHILDCRRKYTSLNFQTYINFGFRPYDKTIKSYLKSKGTPFNTIDKAPLDELLLYGGLDSYWTEELRKKQHKTYSLKSNASLRRAKDFFHEGLLCFADMQMNGIPVNEEYYNTTNKELKSKIIHLKKGLFESEEAKKFKELEGRPINMDSPADLGRLFYEIFDRPKIYTEKGNYITDQTALKRMKLPFANNLLEYKKLEKVRGTYLSQFIREMDNGKMFPFIDLHIPISMRSSISLPSFQNIPVRDEESRKLCRTGIVPSPGNMLLESDYSSLEVMIAACVTGDPALIAHITDPNNDMHRDIAADIWMLNTNEVTKIIRFFVKNGWVFPQFYGSYFVNCAKDLWENVIGGGLKTTDGKLIKEHMFQLGIKNLDEFTEHCEAIEDKFWNERFVVYKKWKYSIQKEFQKNNCIENKFGFRFTGNLSFNDISNYPIQSTAFHCLLWTLIKLMKLAKEEKWKSKIIGQIHDSSIIDTFPPELDYVIGKINQIGTKDIVKENPWINVPLEIEHEITPIDGNWCEKEEYVVND